MKEYERPQKILKARRNTCYTCTMHGSMGMDYATGKPICWCLAKNCIVGPELGCRFYQPMGTEELKNE